MLLSKQLVRAMGCFLLLSTLFSLRAHAEAPWYQVEGIAGIKATGRCIETMSAIEVMEGVRLGIAKVVSEKIVAGKVTELRFAFQGQVGTIYRDKEACEVVARAAHRKDTTIPEKYK